MESEENLDDVLKNLLKDVEQQNGQKVFTEFILILICVTLLSEAKKKPELYEGAKKKVLETLKTTTIYNNYIEELKKKN